MASTWTCASGHTHDLSKSQVHIEPAATPGLECKTSGDRIASLDYNSTVAAQVPKKTFTASTRLTAVST
jgi:hypothetical protein